MKDSDVIRREWNLFGLVREDFASNVFFLYLSLVGTEINYKPEHGLWPLLKEELRERK